MQHLIRLLALTLLLFLLALATVSVAAQAESDDEAQGTAAVEDSEPSHEIETTVVRSTRIREAGDDPSSFTTVIRPEQFASQFRTTEELISRTPGVNILSYSGLGQYSTVSIRGSSSEQVLVLLDGVRLNTGEGGSVDFSTIPVDSIKKIEVVRGGGTTIYGSDAIGGVVNIVTQEPDGPPKASAAFTYGSLNTLKGWATASGGTRGVSGLLSVTHFQSDGDFSFETPEVTINGVPMVPSREETRLNNDFFSDNVLLKADFTLTKDLTLTFNNDFFYTERGQAGTVWDPRLLARQDLLRNMTNLRLTCQGLIFPELDVYLMLFNRYEYNHFRDPEPYLGAGKNEIIDNLTQDYYYGVEVGADLFHSLWKMDHNVSFRGDFRREDLRDDVESWMEDDDYGDPYRMVYEWFLQDEIVLLGNLLSLCPAVHYQESTDFGGYWTGKIGVVAKPLTWLTLRSNFQNSYREPSFSELYFPSNGYIKGNPDLEPEKALNFDVGFGVEFPRFLVQTAYFQNWIDESILWLPVSKTLIMPVNTGPVDQYGVEFDTEYRPLDILFLSATYTYLHAISEQTGKQQDGRPRHVVNFRASVRETLGEFYVEGQYMSSIPVHTTNTGMETVNGRTTVNLGLTLNMMALPGIRTLGWLDKWTLNFEVSNVGDVSAYDAQLFPLPGRMFFGTIHAAI